MYGLGVDLGTSFTAAAIGEGGRVRPLLLTRDGVLAPAVVRCLPDGSLLAGETPEPGTEEPGLVARGVKRRLGDPSTLLLAGQPHSAVSLLAVMLRAVVDTATEHEGRPPDHVALTYPAVWGPYRREQFEEVARLAGVENVTLITEPEAAVVPHQVRTGHGPGEVLAVYDLGGGTFDTAVVRIAEHGLDSVGTPEGLEWVGGIDFDEAVLAWVDRALDGAVSALDERDPAHRLALERLRRDCVLAKEALSREHVTSIVAVLPGRQTELRLARADLEALVRAPVEATLGSVRRTIGSAGLAPGDLSGILLAGGSSQIPLVTRMLEAEFGRPVLAQPNPKLAVALGAALVADAVLTGEPAAGRNPARNAVARATAAGPAALTTGASRPSLPAAATVGGEEPEAGAPPASTDPASTDPASTDPVPPTHPARSRRGRLVTLATGLVVALVTAGAVGFALSDRQRGADDPGRGTPLVAASPVATTALPTTAPPTTAVSPTKAATRTTAPTRTEPRAAVPTGAPPAKRTTAASSWFRIVNVHSAKCAGVGAAPAWSGVTTLVMQKTCNTSDRAQQWRFEATAGGTYRVVNRELGTLVWSADAHGGPGDNGTLVQARRYGGDESQQWTQVALTDDSVNFVVRSSGKCLDVAGAGTTDGVELQQWNCDQTDGQKFRRVPA